MKYLFLAIILTANSFIAYAQNSDEVEINGDPEVAGLVSKNVGKELPQGVGCEALPEKNGCSARLMCYGQSKIYNLNADSKMATIEEAREFATVAYVEFIEDVKVDKNKNCVKKVGRLMENNQSKEKIAKLCTEAKNYSTSGLARSLETIATKVDAKQMEVTVVLGRRCEGVNVRDAIKKQDQKGNASGRSGGGDEFDSVEATEGIESKTYEIGDF